MVFQMPMESFDPRCTLGVEELLERCGLEKEYADRYPQIVYLSCV